MVCFSNNLSRNYAWKQATVFGSNNKVLNNNDFCLAWFNFIVFICYQNYFLVSSFLKKWGGARNEVLIRFLPLMRPPRLSWRRWWGVYNIKILYSFSCKSHFFHVGSFKFCLRKTSYDYCLYGGHLPRCFFFCLFFPSFQNAPSMVVGATNLRLVRKKVFERWELRNLST